jgi:phosphoribosyl 1,2-cyclic phosphodiesterase
VRYGGNTACVEVRSADGDLIILDAGTGLRGLGAHLTNEKRITIVITHPHWDHIEGLAFFKPVYDPNCKVRILTVVPDGVNPVSYLLGPFRKPNFPVSPAQMLGIKSVEALKPRGLRVGSVTIQWRRVNHPDPTAGLRLSESGRSLVYYTDNEISNESEALFEDLADFARGADYMIQDTMYRPEELKVFIGWGHSSYAEAVMLASAAAVKNLVLFHYAPGRSDAEMDDFVRTAASLAASLTPPVNVLASREGMTIEI